MVPLADTHVHLLAGLDDGPRDPDEAAAMCRTLAAEGVRYATALAHQNESYPDNTPDRLRAAGADLSSALRGASSPLSVHPTAEIVLTPDLVEDWLAGRLLSVGGHGQFLLVEMPHGMFLDVRPLAARFREVGVRLVIAHAERYEELLEQPGLVEGFIAAGCLIQVTAGGLASPPSAAAGRTLKDWARRGVIHLLGSDGHRMAGRREPRMRAGYEALARWAGPEAADRVGGIWGAALLQGLPVRVPPPAPRSRSWLSRLFS
jgi:protein-tyrosine phosphatase